MELVATITKAIITSIMGMGSVVDIKRTTPVNHIAEVTIKTKITIITITITTTITTITSTKNRIVEGMWLPSCH